MELKWYVLLLLIFELAVAGAMISLFFIKADKGASGPQGAPGKNGTNGTNGTDGKDGKPGPRGDIGPKGEAGGSVSTPVPLSFFVLPANDYILFPGASQTSATYRGLVQTDTNICTITCSDILCTMASGLQSNFWIRMTLPVALKSLDTTNIVFFDGRSTLLAAGGTKYPIDLQAFEILSLTSIRLRYVCPENILGSQVLPMQVFLTLSYESV